MKKIILSAGKKIRNIFRRGKQRTPRIETKPELTDSPDVVSEKVDSGSQAGGDVSQPREAAKYRKPQKPKKPPWTLDEFQVTPEEGKSRFHDYDIPLTVMRGIAEQKFEYCTPIQEKSLKGVLGGRDLVGKANTGTGKTAVFLLAIFARLLKEKRGAKGFPRALVLAPTRELVAQIAKDATELGKYSHLSIRVAYGGVDYRKQMELLQDRQCDLLIATPGRLIDFINKKVIHLSKCGILVLDEADRMLDMGFIPDVRRIVGRLPAREKRQTMLFSATVPDDVQRLASQWCVKPEVVEAEPEQVAVETVEQVIYLTTAEEKYTVLYNLIKQNSEDRIIVFANMKNEAKRLADRLQRNGIDCVLLSGDVAQNKRMKRLENFREGKVKILVATDVAGRGIHIEGITFVVNYTLPYEPGDYVHRIGRTGRAGAEGKAVSFACEQGSFYLPEIEEYIGRKFECILPEENLLETPPPAKPPEKSKVGSRPSANRNKPRSGKRNYNRRPAGKSTKSGS
jgi:ATP-dependent RNA helicase RhlB